MEKRIIVVNGIVLANTKAQAISQFNTFCKGTPEACHNKDNIWFVKCCKASPVPGNFKSLIGKPFNKLPEDDFREAEFVIANFKLYDTKAKEEARKLYPTLLAWKVAATREL
jgi:hypothetical protein